MRVKIGVIGTGEHGTRYLRHARRDVPGLEPVALCRRNRTAGQEQARQWGCRYHREPESLIEDPQVDAVVVVTPPASHFRLAEAVLAAGKPLLLEKPLTGTLAEADALCRLDRRASVPLMLAQTLRWNPVVQKVKELWPRLGRVHLVRLAQRLAPTRLAWQRDLSESVGGSVLLTGVHLFDLVRFLTGREFVAVDSRQAHHLNPVTEDFFLARAELDDGTTVSLEVSKYTRSRACWLEAVGEAGQLRADYQNGGVLWLTGTEATELPADATLPTLPAVLTSWLGAITAGGPMPVTAADGVRTLEMVAACYLSHRHRRTVTIAELRD